MCTLVWLKRFNGVNALLRVVTDFSAHSLVKFRTVDHAKWTLVRLQLLDWKLTLRRMSHKMAQERWNGVNGDPVAQRRHKKHFKNVSWYVHMAIEHVRVLHLNQGLASFNSKEIPMDTSSDGEEIYLTNHQPEVHMPIMLSPGLPSKAALTPKAQAKIWIWVQLKATLLDGSIQNQRTGFNSRILLLKNLYFETEKAWSSPSRMSTGRF